MSALSPSVYECFPSSQTGRTPRQIRTRMGEADFRPARLSAGSPFGLPVIHPESRQAIDSHVHSHKIPSAATQTVSASNCSDDPNSRPQLFTKPFVSRFVGESRMPCHEIRKGLHLTRRFHDAHTSHDRSDLCQSARHRENQVSLCDGKDCGHKEWQSKRDAPLRAKLRQSAIH